MRQTLCLVKNEHSFRPGMRGLKTIFNNTEELLTYCMDDDNVLRQAGCAFRNLFLNWSNGPLSSTQYNTSICNKVFRTMFLKPDSVVVIPRGGYRMWDRQSVEAFQCLAYISWTRNTDSYASNGMEVHLAGVPNAKVNGYCEETNEVFEYLGCFWHGCLCMSKRHKPIAKTEENMQNRIEKTKTRLQKIENPKLLKHITESRKGRRSTMWTL